MRTERTAKLGDQSGGDDRTIIGRAVRQSFDRGRLGEALLEPSGATPARLGEINGLMKDAIYGSLGDRKTPGG